MTITDPSERMKAALEAPDVPHIYFNGFVNALGTGDIIVVLEQNNKPVAKLNMSYTVAKTFAAKLGATVAQLEEATNRRMLTTDEIEKAMTSPPENVQ